MTNWELELINTILCAATDPSKWLEVVDRIAGRFPEQIIDLSIFDAHARLDQVIIRNVDPEFVNSYVDYYVDLNPWKPIKLALPPAPKVSWAHELYSIEEFKKSQFYNELMSPAGGFCDGHGTTLFNDGERHVSLVANYNPKYRREAEELAGILAQLSGLMQKSLEISRQLHGAHVTGSILQSVMDCLEPAAFIVDKRLKLICHNASAESVLQARNVVTINREGKLRCLESEDETAMLTGLHEPEQTGITMRAKQRPLYARLKRPYDNPSVALIAPLNLDHSPRTNLFNPFGTQFRHYLILLIAAKQAPRTNEAALMAALGVTPAEARLALSLLSGKSMQQHADIYRISKNTVRSQIKSLFSKTGARGQTMLIRQLTALFSAYKQL